MLGGPLKPFGEFSPLERFGGRVVLLRRWSRISLTLLLSSSMEAEEEEEWPWMVSLSGWDIFLVGLMYVTG